VKDLTMRLSTLLAGLACGCLAVTATARAQDARVARGQAFAQASCASCHAIGRTGDSPLRAAPPLRTLHLRYPVDTLAESLAEGITTGHPAMPQFKLDMAQIGDLIAYLKSLE
jgi:mono/diheme cytochrome c family protein